MDDDIDIKFVPYEGYLVEAVDSIVNLAKTLGIKTVAEYVEDEEIYTMIQECGIDYAQGYYVGKPQPYLLDA